jgi:DnaJ like chaperone protein
MSYWGKLVGGVVGFAMGGPPGAVMGAALGHAADKGAIPKMQLPGNLFDTANLHPARLAGLFAPKDQMFALSVVALAAKLAKCDGPVSRKEIDAFKRHFRVPPESARGIGRLFDQARQNVSDYETYAEQLGEAFADNRGLLEDVLAGLFGIARADGVVNEMESAFLSRCAHAFGLDGAAWERARGGTARPQENEPDPYAVLGVSPNAPGETIHAAWKKLMRENHPDSLASKGVPQEFIDRAGEKVAMINAAWDRVKRDRNL